MLIVVSNWHVFAMDSDESCPWQQRFLFNSVRSILMFSDIVISFKAVWCTEKYVFMASRMSNLCCMSCNLLCNCEYATFTCCCINALYCLTGKEGHLVLQSTLSYSIFGIFLDWLQRIVENLWLVCLVVYAVICGCHCCAFTDNTLRWLQEHFVSVGSVQWQCWVCFATFQQTVSVRWSWSGGFI